MSSPTELAFGLLSRARDDAYVVEQLAHDRAAPDWIIAVLAWSETMLAVTKPEAESP